MISHTTKKLLYLLLLNLSFTLDAYAKTQTSGACDLLAYGRQARKTKFPAITASLTARKSVENSQRSRLKVAEWIQATQAEQAQWQHVQKSAKSQTQKTELKKEYDDFVATYEAIRLQILGDVATYLTSLGDHLKGKSAGMVGTERTSLIHIQNRLSAAKLSPKSDNLEYAYSWAIKPTIMIKR